jgi:threonine dehydratase
MDRKISKDGLYIKTPLLHSKILSDILSGEDNKNTQVLLKLENVQLSNSFKIRGISRLCLKVIFNFPLDFHKDGGHQIDVHHAS